LHATPARRQALLAIVRAAEERLPAAHTSGGSAVVAEPQRPFDESSPAFVVPAFRENVIESERCGNQSLACTATRVSRQLLHLPARVIP